MAAFASAIAEVAIKAAAQAMVAIDKTKRRPQLDRIARNLGLRWSEGNEERRRQHQ
jgi:hypothetical protein